MRANERRKERLHPRRRDNDTVTRRLYAIVHDLPYEMS